MVTKQILIQYNDLQKEIREVRGRIANLEKYIERIEEDGNVADIVSGGDGGIQHFKIEGFPYPEYSKKKTLLLTRKSILVQLESELDEQINEVENFISTVSDSKMRRILTMRFIEDKSFEQIGIAIGYDRTSISKKIDKFMEE